MPLCNGADIRPRIEQQPIRQLKSPSHLSYQALPVLHVDDRLDRAGSALYHPPHTELGEAFNVPARLPDTALGNAIPLEHQAKSSRHLATARPPIIHPGDGCRFIEPACVHLDSELKVFVPEQVRERQIVVRMPL
jgi:hypothetical protein